MSAGNAQPAQHQAPAQSARGGAGWLRRLFLPGDTPAETIVFVVLILVGAAVRLSFLEEIPVGLNVDEAQGGYSAWAVLEHGIDRYGYRYPVHFLAVGTGQNALYSYLCMPFIKVLGLNVLSIRLPQALMGVASLFVMYAIGRRLVGRRFALFALFVLTISPWHIMMSRWGLEASLLPAVLLLSFACLLRGMGEQSPRSIIAAFFLLSLSLYAYGPAYVFVPLFTIGALGYAVKERLPNIRHWGAGLAVMLVTATPIGLFLAVNLFEWDAIETPLLSIPRLTVAAESRWERFSVFFYPYPEVFERMWLNAQALVDILVVTGHDGRGYNALPEFGYFYLWRGTFLSLAGMILLVRDLRVKAVHHALLLVWPGAAILTAVCVVPNINRINVVFFPLLLCAAYSLYRMCVGSEAEALRQATWSRLAARTVGVASLLYLSWSFAAFTTVYFSDSRTRFVPATSYSKALDHILHNARDGDTIYVSNDIAHRLVLFYARVDPRVYAEAVTYECGDPGCISFGRYKFTPIDPRTVQKGNVFFILGREGRLFPPSDFMVVNFRHYSAVYRRHSGNSE